MLRGVFPHESPRLNNFIAIKQKEIKAFETPSHDNWIPREKGMPRSVSHTGVSDCDTPTGGDWIISPHFRSAFSLLIKRRHEMARVANNSCPRFARLRVYIFDASPARPQLVSSRECR
jgi:hypothetical protein